MSDERKEYLIKILRAVDYDLLEDIYMERQKEKHSKMWKDFDDWVDKKYPAMPESKPDTPTL